jgi:hypothetical protein
MLITQPVKIRKLGLTALVLLLNIARPVGESRNSKPIKAIHVGNPISVLNNRGDTWVGAWADDNEIYSPSNDTTGFGVTCDSNVAFNRITGDDPLRLTGVTINPMIDYGKGGMELADRCNWKSSGCLSIDGVFYWVVARHHYGETSGDPFMRQTAQNASIIKSLDKGKTWTRPARENYDRPMFPGPRFAAPYFIQYGRDGKAATVDQADRYVYAVSNNGFWDNGDNMILGRVLRTKIGDLKGSDWEFFTGGDGALASSWNPDMNKAKWILDEPDRLGMTGPVYLPEFGRYLMIGWYYPAGGGKKPDAWFETVWDFYESPKPWGPWTKIGSHHFAPQGYYGPGVCLKFSEKGGRRVFAVTAGDWHNLSVYRFTLVPLDLE